jgi:RNA polymerase-binding transcription factor DksA
MKKADLTSIRRQLTDLRNRLQPAVSDLQHEAFRALGGEASGNLSHTPLHLADLGTDTSEQTMALSLLEQEGHTLEEIDAALARLQARTFGRCEACRRKIAQARLAALPYVRHCIACARQLERDGLAGGR